MVGIALNLQGEININTLYTVVAKVLHYIIVDEGCGVNLNTERLYAGKVMHKLICLILFVYPF